MGRMRKQELCLPPLLQHEEVPKPRPGIGEEAVKMRNQRAQQPGSWKCLCGNQNFPGRTICNSRRCGLSQEQGMVELVSDDGRRVNMRGGGEVMLAQGALATA